MSDAARLTADRAAPRSHVRLAWWTLALAVVTGAVYLMATASTGPV